MARIAHYLAIEMVHRRAAALENLDEYIAALAKNAGNAQVRIVLA
jgi:hypothetical protein